jgi:hypothetical protein
MKTQRPVFVYSMTPRDRTSYKHFFELGPLKALLENPGQLRGSGWDLLTHDKARIVRGEYLELTSAERKRIQVYEDGSVLVRVSGDEDFMSWGQNTKNFDDAPRLNTLALIEFTLNFCKFCSGLVQYMEPEPSEVNLKVEVRNAFFGESKLFLIPHPVTSRAFTFTDDRHVAPESSGTRKLVVSAEQLKSRPDIAAFLLVRQIFYWFGVNTETIPYTSTANGVAFIDESLIINSRSS